MSDGRASPAGIKHKSTKKAGGLIFYHQPVRTNMNNNFIVLPSRSFPHFTIIVKQSSTSFEYPSFRKFKDIT